MKIIEKKSVVPLLPITGSITDTLNVKDKVKNAPSINLVEQMTGIPTEGIIQFDGDEIPEGYEEIGNPNLEVYSLEEILIGKWINNKPIYRKVIDAGPLKNNSDVIIDVPELNIDRIIDAYGFTVVPNTNEQFLPLVHKAGTANVAFFYNFQAQRIQLSINGDRTANTETFIILEYTKTTD